MLLVCELLGVVFEVVVWVLLGVEFEVWDELGVVVDDEDEDEDG